MLLSLLAAAGAAIQPAADAAGEPYARTSHTVVVPVQRERQRDLEEWGYADAVVDGDRVWLSGVVAGLRPDETIADEEAAFERAFERIGDVLERSGASFDGVVEMTSFHTDLPAQIEAFKKVKHHYIRGPFPAWTAIGVTRLVPDWGLVEIRIVARRRPGI